MAKWVVIVAILLLGIVAATVVWRSIPPIRAESFLKNDHVDVTRATEFWRESIQARGPAKSAEVFLSVGNQLSISQAHSLAHTFGAALYQELGVAGSLHCDEAFVNGCLHQLMGMAIDAEGMSVVAVAAKDCDTYPCEHAIGHGVVAYFGYDTEGLSEALRTCDVFDTPGDRRQGCRDGAFMEFNLREMSALDTGNMIDPRPIQIDKTNIFSPCYEVDKKYQTACAFELPNWWIATSERNNVSERIEEAGTRCQKLGSMRLSCFTGIGNVATPAANLDPRIARTLCMSASENHLDREACLMQAARRFVTEGKTNLASICRALSLSEKVCPYGGNRDRHN